MSSIAESNDTIAKYVDQNNWVGLETIFNSARGYIGEWGGRYCSHQTEGSIYLEHICWRIFRQDCATPLKELPTEQRRAANNVLIQLRRIYDETETQRQLKGHCSFASVTTKLYDFCNQIRHDGYPSGIDRCEDVIRHGLQNPIKSE